MSDPPAALVERVEKLDSSDRWASAAPEMDPDVVRFIQTMEVVTSRGAHAPCPETHPQVADAVMARCRLLDRLAAKAPEVVSGPVRLDRQYWVATQGPLDLPSRVAELTEREFVAVRRGARLGVGSKPTGAGLYTSTGLLGDFGMWWSYLQLNRGSTLHGLPWKVWAMGVREDARVLEITSAADWVAFVSACSLPSAKGLAPDWARAAERWDGVHITARTVAATQGIRLVAGERAVAPPYWDVETTLWLRWAFDAPKCVAEVE